MKEPSELAHVGGHPATASKESALQAWLKYRQQEWGLSDTMVTLVPLYFTSETETTPISYEAVIDLLQEQACPEVLLAVLNVICFSVHPTEASFEATLRALESLQSRDSKLLISSMMILSCPQSL
ncbi:hypothetical protein DSO57_1008284 [Entomophthora muscae]|uniref:Uncharacterized protein n=1 Tax=Entomophthora muscae TaxID=34485 RepID=A0ACC2USQ6_9FUNG|nr:hypothetical protein DSO57_1008284 [Entomophthora muscae]